MKHSVIEFQSELMKLVGLGGREMRKLTVTVEVNQFPSVEVEGLQPEGQYFVDLEKVINSFQLVPVGGTVSADPPESWPAGTVRYPDETGNYGAWVTASPHSPHYSTATMLATEFWNARTHSWESILVEDASD